MSDESSVPVSAASTQAPSARGGDAAYEAGQIAAIARWKSTAPSRLGAVIDTATAPVTWLVGHFIPRNAVVRLVTSMEEIAATLAAAGVPSGFHEGAADIFRIIHRTPFASETRETVDPGRRPRAGPPAFRPG